MSAESALQVFDPIASVLLVARHPEHDAVAVSLVVLPVAFVVVSGRVRHSAVTPLHPFLPVALVDRAVFITKFAVTVTHAIKPSSLVLDTFLVVYVSSVTVPKSVKYLPFVGATIRPSIVAFAGDFVLTEFTFVNGPVSPFKSAFSVKKAVS